MDASEKNRVYITIIPGILRMMIKSVNCCLEAVAQTHRLKIGHISYIMTLNYYGKLTMKELSERTSMDKSNTTRVISYLKSVNIADDDRVSASSKKYNVFLTEYGRSVAAEAKKEVDSMVSEMFSDISEEELNALENTLKKIRISPNIYRELDEAEKQSE